MKIYNYDRVTLQYIGESNADQSPLEADVWLIPAYATTIPPLEQLENKLVCFIDGLWVYQELPKIDLVQEPDHFATETKQSLTDMILASPEELVKLKIALGIA